MLTITAFILPTIALVMTLCFFYRPLPLLFGFDEVQHEAQFDPQLVREMAFERKQSEEYETLIDMGFQPLGGLHESVRFLKCRPLSLVFEHRSLPVFAALCQDVSGLRFVCMSTEGQGKKRLRSSSSEFSLQAHERDLRAIVVKADHIEDVFEAHLLAMYEWERDGFVPTSCDGLSGYVRQCREILGHPLFSKQLRTTCLTALIGSATMLIFFPAVLGILSTCLALTMFKFAVTFTIGLQIFSGWSLLFGFVLYRMTSKFVPRETTNSLHKGGAVCASKTDKIESTEINGIKIFPLPIRGTKCFQRDAAMYVLAMSAGAMMVSIVGGVMGLQLLKGNLSIFGLSFVTIQAIGLYIFASIGIYSLRIALNKTQHAIQLCAGQIIAREKHLLFDYKQECQISMVDSIRIKSLKNCPNEMYCRILLTLSRQQELFSIKHNSLKQHYLAGKNDDERGVMLFQDAMKQTILFAAPAYRVDLLVSLAEKIAKEIGLDEKRVKLSDEFVISTDRSRVQQAKETNRKLAVNVTTERLGTTTKLN